MSRKLNSGRIFSDERKSRMVAHAFLDQKSHLLGRMFEMPKSLSSKRI